MLCLDYNHGFTFRSKGRIGKVYPVSAGAHSSSTYPLCGFYVNVFFFSFLIKKTVASYTYIHFRTENRVPLPRILFRIQDVPYSNLVQCQTILTNIFCGLLQSRQTDLGTLLQTRP